MSIPGTLTAAAASIGLMPDGQLARRLEQLEATHRRRSTLERARHRAELDSLDLDWAAYQLACRYDDDGDLAAAARWYTMAAANDFADAALRLGTVLDMLAARCATAAGSGPDRYTCEREELALVSDAARWYAEAYAAGHPDAAGRLDGMISRHDTRHPRAALPTQPASPAGKRCERGGLSAVINAGDLTAATAHFRHCTPCQHEFIRLGGLLPAPQTHTTPDDTCDQHDADSHLTLLSERTG